MTLAELRATAALEEADFKAWDSMAVELEVAELLYAFVRAMKPELVVEAGAGNGYASAFIAHALADNHRGYLVSFEQDEAFGANAKEKLLGLPAAVVSGWSSSWGGVRPDLVFLDSLGGPDGRDADLHHWLVDRAGDGHVVVVHDANGYPDLPTTGVRLTAGRGVWIGQA